MDKKECNINCIVHGFITHNTCIGCKCFETSPYFQDAIKGKSKEQIEKLKNEAMEEM